MVWACAKTVQAGRIIAIRKTNWFHGKLDRV